MIITPFGTPVEPDVNSRWARSGAGPERTGASAGSDARSSRAKAEANRSPANGASIAPTVTASRPTSGPPVVPSSPIVPSTSVVAEASARISDGSAADTMRATRGAGLALSTGT